jgi:hypothetical protein
MEDIFPKAFFIQCFFNSQHRWIKTVLHNRKYLFACSVAACIILLQSTVKRHWFFNQYMISCMSMQVCMFGMQAIGCADHHYINQQVGGQKIFYLE